MPRTTLLIAALALSSCTANVTPALAFDRSLSDAVSAMCDSRGAVFLVTAASRIRGDSWTMVEHRVQQSQLDGPTRRVVRDAYYGTSPTDTEIDINRRANAVVSDCLRTGGAM